MRLFDAHAHLLDERFDADRGQILDSLGEDLVGVMECATCPEDMRAAAELAANHPHIYCAVGVHPQQADEFSEETPALIRKLLQGKRCVAVGEIGLDYYYETAARELQRRVFREQLALACEQKVPVVIHMRDATEDTLRILSEFPETKGVMHCFSGSAQTAQELLKRGFYISFSGTVTFKNAVNVVNAAKTVPLDRLLAETDSPYLAPHPNRGKRNQPSFVEYTIRKLAELKGISFEEMCEQNIRNFRRLYGVTEEI